MRILIAGLLGAIAMFVRTSFAHMATPLDSAGISQMANEPAVLSAMQKGVGGKAGFYFFPWVSPADPKAFSVPPEDAGGTSGRPELSTASVIHPQRSGLITR